MDAARDQLERLICETLQEAPRGHFEWPQADNPQILAKAVADALAACDGGAGWLIWPAGVRVVESVRRLGPAGEEKESDRWDVYTAFREGDNDE